MAFLVCSFTDLMPYDFPVPAVCFEGFPDLGESACNAMQCNAGDPSSIPGLGRSPGEGIAYPFHPGSFPLTHPVHHPVQQPPAQPCLHTWALLGVHQHPRTCSLDLNQHSSITEKSIISKCCSLVLTSVLNFRFRFSTAEHIVIHKDTASFINSHFYILCYYKLTY